MITNMHNLYFNILKNDFETDFIKYVNNSSDIYDENSMLHDEAGLKDIKNNTIEFEKSVNLNKKFYESSRTQADTLIQNVSKEITIIENMNTIKDCIKVALEIKRQVNDGTFYGCIVTDGEMHINLFNPTSLISLQKKMLDETSKELQLLVYRFPDIDIKKEINNEINRNGNKLELEIGHDEIIRNIIAFTADKVSREYISVANIFEQNLLDKDIEDLTAEIFYKIKNDGENNYRSIIVGHQILTEGILIPYYGASIVILESYRDSVKSKGFQLSPMMTPNIHSDNTVCTGRHSNIGLYGLSSLHHANLSSPYFRDILCYGALDFADMCIEMMTLLLEEVIKE
jgi:hypothetical protein